MNSACLNPWETTRPAFNFPSWCFLNNPIDHVPNLDLTSKNPHIGKVDNGLPCPMPRNAIACLLSPKTSLKSKIALEHTARLCCRVDTCAQPLSEADKSSFSDSREYGLWAMIIADNCSGHLETTCKSTKSDPKCTQGTVKHEQFEGRSSSDICSEFTHQSKQGWRFLFFIGVAHA